jgi:hypothetical protein
MARITGARDNRGRRYAFAAPSLRSPLTGLSTHILKALVAFHRFVRSIVNTDAMSSLRRGKSSRANGARSRGPATPEGKRRSSYNAVRHGLLAQCVVMAAEAGENFELILRQHVDRFAPADGVEFAMVEEMASSYWRLRRAWAIETRMLDDAFNAQTSGDQLGCIATGFKDLAAQPSLQLLLRYQASLHRTYTRALHNLLLLRANYETNRDYLLDKVSSNRHTVCRGRGNEPDRRRQTVRNR